MFKKEASRHPEIFQDRFNAIRALNRQFVENNKCFEVFLLDTLKTTF